MQIEQAIFTSAQTAAARGYHLVARSPGIDDRLAQLLALWAPSENSLIDRDVDADSLNVFAPDADWIALSRTVSADAEYSDRGQFRMETNMVLLRQEQLASYENNPLAAARAVIASGYLRLRPVLPATLASLSLPESLGVRTGDDKDLRATSKSTFGESADTLDKHPALQAMLSGADPQRLVIVGCENPLDFLESLFRTLPQSQRLDVSFSTGLKPSTHRPFRLQFLPQVNLELTRELEARGMRCLSM